MSEAEALQDALEEEMICTTPEDAIDLIKALRARGFHIVKLDGENEPAR